MWLGGVTSVGRGFKLLSVPASGCLWCRDCAVPSGRRLAQCTLAASPAGPLHSSLAITPNR